MRRAWRQFAQSPTGEDEFADGLPSVMFAEYYASKGLAACNFEWISRVTMRALFLGSAILIALGIITTTTLAQDDIGQRPSPPAKASCAFADGKTIHVDYSSPRMRGRKIFGDLVPYGEEWRAGANEATTFAINTDVTIQGKTVPAGNYTLFTLPNRDKWQLIISKLTGEWGIPYPGASHDFARMEMQVSSLPAPVENFLISFVPAGNKCTMRLDWEKTRVSGEIIEKK
jgi:hypothetical protein